MRAAPLLVLAFIPGLCDKPQDPSRGVPPEIWALRRVMETEVSKDAGGREFLSEENRARLRDAAEAVCRWELVKDPDAAAEVLYLLPRFWHWDHREALRDLLVLLNVGKAGPALEAEATEEWMKPALAERKAVFGAIDRLHREVAALAPEARAGKVLDEMEAGAWANPKFGNRRGLFQKYVEMACVHAGAGALPRLEKLAGAPGVLQEWAAHVLERTKAQVARDAAGAGR